MTTSMPADSIPTAHYQTHAALPDLAHISVHGLLMNARVA
jgi:hypothetical protein